MAEYVVLNPVTIEAEFEGGEVMRYPQEIRERIVRCRDCERPVLDEEGLLACPDIGSFSRVDPNGFCAWGFRSGR